MDRKLTTLQAFNAMTKFLDNYYNKTSSDDVGSLLGDMSFLQEGCTADPATWGDWIDAVGTDQSLTKIEAYNAMIKFLDYYRENTSSDDIAVLLNSMQLSENGTTKDPKIGKLWETYVNESLNDPEGSKYYLHLTK